MFPCSRGLTNPSALHCLNHIECLREALTKALDGKHKRLNYGKALTHIFTPAGAFAHFLFFSRPRPRNWSSVLMSTKWTTLSSLESSIRSLVRWESSWVVFFILFRPIFSECFPFFLSLLLSFHIRHQRKSCSATMRRRLPLLNSSVF